MTERAKKMLLDLGVGHQIDVAMAVTRLDVGEPVPLLGQRAQRLGQKADASTGSSESSPVLVAMGIPSRLDEVGDLDLLEAREAVLQRVAAAKELQFALTIAQAQEGRFPRARIATTRPATCTERPPASSVLCPHRTCRRRCERRRNARADRRAQPGARRARSLANGFSPRARMASPWPREPQ